MKRTTTSRTFRPEGFALIEMLVVLGILALLMALLLPAVQSARESARRVMCINNLKQIGLGVQGYISDYSTFPPGGLPSYPGKDFTYNSFYSPFARILPQLDNAVLYNSINFSSGSLPLTVSGKFIDEEVNRLAAINSSVFRTGLAVFLCPSDGGTFGDAGCNYRGNVGVGPHAVTNVLHPDSGNGLIAVERAVSIAFVPDGLSHTAAFSERLRGSGNPDSPSPERDVFDASTTRMRDASEALTICRSRAYVGAPTWTHSGSGWFWTGRDQTLYSHTQAPDGVIPDCLFSKLATLGMATARSHHPGGVNVLMGDGSVRFVLGTISQPTWQALGTRNGGELVD